MWNVHFYSKNKYCGMNNNLQINGYSTKQPNVDWLIYLSGNLKIIVSFYLLKQFLITELTNNWIQ